MVEEICTNLLFFLDTALFVIYFFFILFKKKKKKKKSTLGWIKWLSPFDGESKKSGIILYCVIQLTQLLIDKLKKLQWGSKTDLINGDRKIFIFITNKKKKKNVEIYWIRKKKMFFFCKRSQKKIWWKK